MPSIAYTGTVYPLGVKLSLPPMPELTVSGGISGTVKVYLTVDHSELRVRCEGDNLSDGCFMECYLYALEVARAMVNIGGFHQGQAFQVVIKKFVATDGIERDFSLADPQLQGIVSAYDVTTNMQKMGELAFAEADVRYILQDLNEAILHPSNTATLCGRILEAIRTNMSPNEPSEPKAWTYMRTALNVDRAYIQPITDQSKDPRHGRRTPVPGLLNQELSRRTWHVTNRFFEYKIRGKVALNLSLFPLLS